ncbi:MAG: MotA/TolQ/ExbB proton channel family protein [Myxococcota bacterium]
MEIASMYQLSVQTLNIMEMILNSRGMVLLDLIVLIIFSLLTWYIIVFKGVFYSRIKKNNSQFLEKFWSGNNLDQIFKFSKNLPGSSLSQLYKAGYNELIRLKKRKKETPGSQGEDLKNLERALHKSSMVQITKLESLLPILATISATAPFLGLFGTVWGIMTTFSSIGIEGNTTLSTVAPGIVDALVTTALGLIAAIPATIAYNYFLRKVKLQIADMETFANDFLNIAQRKFFQ